MTAATVMPTGRQVAFDLDISTSTFGRWCLHWLGPIGKGHHRRLDPVDQRAGRAWQALASHVADRHAAEVRRLVADAIRRRPEGRWVAYDLAAGWAATFDTLNQLASAGPCRGLLCVGVIDLDPAEACS